MKNKIIILALMCTALLACNKGTVSYTGHWKKLDKPNVVLEITDEGNDHVVISKTNINEWKRPVRKVPITIDGGALIFRDIQVGIIQKDGSLLFDGAVYVRQSVAEIEAMKVTLATPQKPFRPF